MTVARAIAGAGGMNFALPAAIKVSRFRPRLLDAITGYDRGRFLADAGAGVTVGIVALPLAMAFAIASGVKPEQGIFTAIIGGFLISALGGSHVQIGGPAGAFIVIVYGIVQRYGIANLLIATMLAGVLMFLLGWLRLGALVRYIPVSIVIGFTNGIAVLIALSQLKDLLGLQIGKVPADFFAQVHAIATHLHGFNPYAFALGALCVAGLFAWPRLFAPGSPLPGRMLDGAAVRLAARMPGPIVALVTLVARCGMARAAGRDDRHALRRHSAEPARVRLARSELGERSAALHPDTDDRRPRGDRVAAVCARRRQPHSLPAPRSEPGADGAGRRQCHRAVLRRHSGDRHHRPHRHERARRRRLPGRRHHPCGDAAR